MQIRDDYQKWISEPKRKRSGELDFGCWWTLYPDDPPASPLVFVQGCEQVTMFSASDAGRWRVSWIDDTGELYAKHLAHGSDAMIVLGHYPTSEAVEERMEGWAEGGPKALTVFFLEELLSDPPDDPGEHFMDGGRFGYDYGPYAEGIEEAAW